HPATGRSRFAENPQPCPAKGRIAAKQGLISFIARLAQVNLRATSFTLTRCIFSTSLNALLRLEQCHMKKIVTFGEIVVEIMALEPGEGFKKAMPLIGPFPSGAPAIFIDQAAKMGQPGGLVSAVGNDDFGALNIERLRCDGVDVSAIL